MSLSFQILGQPFADNACYVRVEPGQSVHRILFDCGQHCLDSLNIREIMAVDHLCFSHFHLDHLSGFDAFLRVNYQRESKPVHIWGPESTIEIIHHRLQGVTWDRIEKPAAPWILHEIHESEVITAECYPDDGFQEISNYTEEPFHGILFEDEKYTLSGAIMDHRIPTIAYRVTEAGSFNIIPDELKRLGLSPGPWLNQLKDHDIPDSHALEIQGKTYSIGELRALLLSESPGESLGYVTDLRYTQDSISELVDLFEGCDTIVSESTYADEEKDLADRHFHLTASEAGEIAKRAKAKRLILFHLSKRYEQSGATELLSQAQTVFPNTCFPEWWELDPEN